MKQITPIFILIFLISSCHQKQSDKVMYDMATVQEQMAPVTKHIINAPLSQSEKIEKNEIIKKRIIKDGKIGLRVTELEKTKAHVDSLVKNYDGYYANESLSNTDYESSYDLKIRVPSANFEKFITEIENGDGEILYKEIDARDVTDEFIDLETRLENKRNYLKRYNELLKRANTVKEILEIEEKIRGLEEEIESTTGRLKYLSDLVDFSTLNLTISKQKDFKYNPVNRDKFSERLKQSISKGWFGFIDGLLFMIKIWPFWIIVTLVIYFWNKYKRKKKKN